MIRYALRCASSHSFESWFRDSASYDQLAGGGLVVCPQCGSSEVEKALMAPSVQTSRNRRAVVAPEATDPSAAVVPSSLPLQDEKGQALRAKMRELRQKLVEHSIDVGPAFAEEARKIHDGDTDARAIHGVASPGEVRALLDDGIGVLPLPTFPDDAN